MTTNKILIVLCFLLSLQLQAQKYYTRSGSTQFEGSEKAFEPIAATNTSTTVILDTRNGNIVSQVFMAGFQFKNALMQEHFNENYLESDKFPKATFKGDILNFNNVSSLDAKYDVKGMITIHGVSKEIVVPTIFKRNGDTILVKGEFDLLLEDFDIKIPRLVLKKIAKEINVTFEFNHKPYNR